MNTNNELSLVLSHVEPVLPVSSVSDTIAYWQDVIGFTDKWMYGNPPNHGGVSWRGTTHIQFSVNATQDSQSKGQSVWVRARAIHALYHFHQKNGAKIVAPLEAKPWGHSEYTLEDINGYYIHFSAPASDGSVKYKEPPDDVQILSRTPSLKEFNTLMDAVGWTPSIGKETRTQLKSTRYAVVARHKPTKAVVGCALLMGDGVSFFYIKDVMVHPRWQHQRIGTAMMEAIEVWIQKKAPDKSTIGLFTDDHLASFYKQFGFIQACGMYKQIHRK